MTTNRKNMKCCHKIFYGIHSFIVYLTELIFRTDFFSLAFSRVPVDVCGYMCASLLRSRLFLSFLHPGKLCAFVCVFPHFWHSVSSCYGIAARVRAIRIANETVFTISGTLLSLHSSFGAIVKFSRNKFYVETLVNGSCLDGQRSYSTSSK